MGQKRNGGAAAAAAAAAEGEAAAQSNHVKRKLKQRNQVGAAVAAVAMSTIAARFAGVDTTTEGRPKRLQPAGCPCSSLGFTKAHVAPSAVGDSTATPPRITLPPTRTPLPQPPTKCRAASWTS